MKQREKIAVVALFVFALVGAGFLGSAGRANAKNDDTDDANEEREQRSMSTSSFWGGWNHYFHPSYYFPVIIKGDVVSISKKRIIVRVGEGRRSYTVSIAIDKKTVIIGDPSRGDSVRVIAYRDRGGYVAKRIKVIEPGYGDE